MISHPGNDKVLTITEGAKVAAEIRVTYTVKGKRKRMDVIQTIDLEHRNASIWDDDRRAEDLSRPKTPQSSGSPRAWLPWCGRIRTRPSITICGLPWPFTKRFRRMASATSWIPRPRT